MIIVKPSKFQTIIKKDSENFALAFIRKLASLFYHTIKPVQTRIFYRNNVDKILFYSTIKPIETRFFYINNTDKLPP